MAAFPLCSISDCDKPARSKACGLCSAHNHRMRRYGDPLAGSTFRMERPNNCRVDGCSSPVGSRGYCAKHYARNYVHGDPLGGGTDKGALKQWILDHVGYVGEDCLIWPFTASTDGDGYGHLFVDGATVRAPRYMCFLANGEPPTPEHESAHSCGNGKSGCIHPKHLRWATKAENKADMIDHGTAHIGSNAPWAKLNDDQVRQIREMRGIVLQRELAAQFGVSKSLVGLIQLRKRWAYLE